MLVLGGGCYVSPRWGVLVLGGSVSPGCGC